MSDLYEIYKSYIELVKEKKDQPITDIFNQFYKIKTLNNTANRNESNSLCNTQYIIAYEDQNNIRDAISDKYKQKLKDIKIPDNNITEIPINDKNEFLKELGKTSDKIKNKIIILAGHSEKTPYKFTTFHIKASEICDNLKNNNCKNFVILATCYSSYFVDEVKNTYSNNNIIAISSISHGECAQFTPLESMVSILKDLYTNNNKFTVEQILKNMTQEQLNNNISYYIKEEIKDNFDTNNNRDNVTQYSNNIEIEINTLLKTDKFLDETSPTLYLNNLKLDIDKFTYTDVNNSKKEDLKKFIKDVITKILDETDNTYTLSKYYIHDDLKEMDASEFFCI